MLRECGLGTPILERKIQEEISVLLQAIASYDRKPVDPCHILMCVTFNIMKSLILGTRDDYEDPNFRKELAITEKSFEVTQ